MVVVCWLHHKNDVESNNKCDKLQRDRGHNVPAITIKTFVLNDRVLPVYIPTRDVSWRVNIPYPVILWIVSLIFWTMIVSQT